MSTIKIMTHVVAGYRSIEETARLLHIMQESNVDYIEIQIPFSDPIGDGPTITQANQYALDSGMTVEKSLVFFEEMAKITSVPLLVMTYTNVAYRQGFEAFFQRLNNIGAKGAIIPDLPYAFSELDHDSEMAVEVAANAGIPIIPVISPNTSTEKMKDIARRMKENKNDYMVYCTQRTGITGTHSNTDVGNGAGGGIGQEKAALYEYLNNAQEAFDVDVAGGFGIKSSEQVRELSQVLDVAVIGSHIMNLYKDTDKNKSSEIDAAMEKIRSFLLSVTRI